MATSREYIYNFDKGSGYNYALDEELMLNSSREQRSLEDSHLYKDLPGGVKLNTTVSQNYEAPTYEGKYDSRVDELYNTLNNFGQNYNYNTDPAYQAYRKEYLRNGQRATQDTMAAAATMTGGRPSSYAATAAAQAGNNYAAQLSDKIPELYNQAYNRYLQQFQNAQQMQQTDYNRFIQDRSFDYNARQDQINNLMRNRELAYNQMSTDRAFNYQKQQDRINNMQKMQQYEWNNFMDQAKFALEVGDYTLLKHMGFDVSRAGFANEFQMASIIAQVTGDTSAIRALMGKG